MVDKIVNHIKECKFFCSVGINRKEIFISPNTLFDVVDYTLTGEHEGNQGMYLQLAPIGYSDYDREKLFCNIKVRFSLDRSGIFVSTNCGIIEPKQKILEVW